MWKDDPDFTRTNYILPDYVCRGIKAESIKRSMQPRDFITMMFETYSRNNNLEYKRPHEKLRFNSQVLDKPKSVDDLLKRVIIE